MNIHLIAFNCRYSHSCLALFYVRNELERHLPETRTALHQFTINDPYFETLLSITGSQADAWFFSVYIWNASYLLRLLPDLHRVAPMVPIVLGGPQASALREKLFFLPTVVHNEIEGVDRSFYRDLEQGRLQGEYWSAPGQAFPSPYKQDDFQSQLKNRNIYYEASRGCPFFCAYCLSSLSRGVVAKDLDLVKAELLAILQHRPSMIRFVDRTFNADPIRTLTIWRFLQENAPPGCSFHFEIAPDLFSEEMFGFLAGVEEGMFQFEIGIQSTSLETLKAINRKMDVDKAMVVIRRLKTLGVIHLHADLILGLPMEDEFRFGQSVREVLAVQPHYLQMGLLKILPDTAIARQVAEYGIVACQEPPYQVMATRWLDHQALSRLYWLGECLEAFYNKRYFKTFFSYLIPTEGDIFSWFQGLSALCARKGFYSLSKTQGFMNEILFHYIQGHEQAPLLREFLIFDWLSCGHRFLPEVFDEDLAAPKEYLWLHAAEAIDGLYIAKERNYFFKRGVFYRFSKAVLTHCGFFEHESDGVLGFITEHKCPVTTVVAVPVVR
ncbi:MAG: DUF4080 domain-containing protein [Proteobacteria bacterium]|nr:DUF4080 domain-containing protein [Desulfobulbaceae bacterium]MBU4152109.1 DUF4080 domain-containing protein [Pseudomonadota bacterium]